MNDKNLILAANIYERSRMFQWDGDEKSVDQIIKQWLNKKNSLVTEEIFELKLIGEGMDKRTFAAAIHDLTISDADVLYDYIVEQEWYLRHNEILERLDTDDSKGTELAFFARPYCKWVKRKLEELINMSKITIQEQVIENCMDAVQKEVLSIALKTLVYDQNEYFEFQKNSRNENNLEKYLAIRFGTKENYVAFFNDYPVLARLLSIRAGYFVKNFKLFIDSLLEAKKELRLVFGIQKPFELQELVFGNADSHDGGKSVLVFTLNNKKLVFKYKNLEICNAVSEFYKCLEKMDGSFSFYDIRRIVHGTFAIEEFVTYKETENEDALHRYYYRFGQLVMVMYVLGATDLHLENVIAVNDYPVPIDLETVFQNERSIKRDGSAMSNLIHKLNDGILESSLLPNIYWNMNKKNEIEMSALAGKEQKLPFDVLQLENDSDGIMKMTYKPFIMEGSENLPTLQGVKVGYEEYVDDIIAGFSDSYHIILSNKSCLAENLEKLFSEKIVRNVLKSTQKYCDMLQYSYHPSCMTNYLNREKLMENLWAYPYDNPEAIKFEVRQILDNDVPIFYNNTSSRDLLTKDEKIKSYYEAPAISKILERAERISEYDFVRQSNLLYLALGKYKGEKQTISITGKENMDVYSQALGIADYIADHAIAGTRCLDITWPSISATEHNTWFIRPMSYSYYDGVVGIYLMYYALQSSKNINTYQNILYRVENMLFSKVPVIMNHETYIDAISILYALCYKIKSENNGRNKLFAYNVFKQIRDFYRKNKESFTNEWLFGRASLLNLLLTYYEIAGREEAAELAYEVAKDISCEKMEGAGFAHGYAGTLYSLLRFIEIKEGYAQELYEKLLWYRQQLKSIAAVTGEDYSWCKGWAGIGLTLQKTYKVYGGGAKDEYKMLAEIAEKSLSADLKDDCLCHGNFGLAEFISYMIEHGMVGEAANKYKNKVDQICLKNQYCIRGMETFPSFDLMTGMAGLVFGYIRGINAKAPKVLLLEV